MPCCQSGGRILSAKGLEQSSGSYPGSTPESPGSFENYQWTHLRTSDVIVWGRPRELKALYMIPMQPELRSTDLQGWDLTCGVDVTPCLIPFGTAWLL
jgi:hypothetical protein